MSKEMKINILRSVQFLGILAVGISLNWIGSAIFKNNPLCLTVYSLFNGAVVISLMIIFLIKSGVFNPSQES